MDELGFVRSTPAETGTPGYDPRDLLKLYIYDVSKIGYDKFEQRTYLKYCNGAETFYTYDPQRRRLQNLTVNSGGNTIMDNAYTYDAVSNVLSVVNSASVPQSGKAGGQMAHTNTYSNSS